MMVICWHTCIQNIQNIQLYTVLHKYILYIIQYGQSNLIHFYDDGNLLTTDFYSREENTGGKDHAGENKLSSSLSFTLFQPPQTNKNNCLMQKKFRENLAIGINFSLFTSAIDRFFHLICTICAGREIWRWFIGGQIGGSKPDFWE